MERAQGGRARGCGAVGVQPRYPVEGTVRTGNCRSPCSPKSIRTRTGRAESKSDVAPCEANSFICTRESCAIRFDGHQFTLRFRIGLPLLGILLREPGRGFHVCELFAAVHPVDPAMIVAWVGTERDDLSVEGALGPLLDSKAKREYSAKLASLREELKQSEDFHDAGRAESLRRQIEIVRREVARAIGIGGQDRPIGDRVERIRQKVRKNLCAAFKAVGAAHPVLGWHLKTYVKTGRVCRYVPNPRQPVRWDVSLSR